MFFLAPLCIGIALILIRNLKKGLVLLLITLTVFIAIVTPYVIAISNAWGRFTIGEQGPLNYAHFVNGVPLYHWQGESPENGIIKNPTRKISRQHEIYEFGTPVGGTCPIHYDLAYWHDGLKINFNLKNQLFVLLENFAKIMSIPGILLILYSILLFYLISGDKRVFVKGILQRWYLMVIPALIVFMYLLILITTRYIGSSIVILFLSIFSGMKIVDAKEYSRFANVTLISILIIINALTCYYLISEIYILNRDPNFMNHEQWEVALSLKQMGIKEGDKVGFIGSSPKEYWARLAKVRITADMPYMGDAGFKRYAISDPDVIRTFSKARVKAIVTKFVSNGEDISIYGWRRLGATDYYIYLY
ncbi:MAG: hypothetical protein JW994_00640 [Candidatus Omnitrophica bacterium]|nr:hypothetical protein [Candidatus Omnitrophota bacterium]